MAAKNSGSGGGPGSDTTFAPALVVEWRARWGAESYIEQAPGCIIFSMNKDYLEAAIETAQEAGKILREEFDRPVQITYKGEVDLVTQADWPRTGAYLF